jgi:hypothetical protein
MSVSPITLPASVTVRAWIDPVVEALGFEPESRYVECCWLGVLGPTATWLYRRLGVRVTAEPAGSPVDLVDLSVSLGLGEGLGRNSHLAKALARLVRFGIIRWEGDAVAVRRRLAPLSQRLATHLSWSARRVHEEHVGGPFDGPRAA